MIKGAVGIVGLGLVMWAVGCGTHSGIGSLGMGGNGGDLGLGGQVLGLGGHVTGLGGELGIGGQVNLGTGGERPSCPGTGGAAPSGGPRTLSFAPPADYDTGSGAYAVTTGDLNGDGKLDLVLLDHEAGIRIMFNKGDGTFNGPADLGFASAFQAAVGDIDGDGKLDIVALSQSGVSVILNRGNATFAPPASYVVGIGSQTLALGDLNGDGKLDIAVVDLGDGTSAGGDVGILENTGGGTFVAANYPTGRDLAAIAIGDLNNDCTPDLALAGNAGVTVMVNVGGQFPIVTNFASGTSGTSIAVADLNGDGKLDVVEGAGSVNNGLSYVLLNRGNAFFNAPVVYSSNGSSGEVEPPQGGNPLALVDMNNDGRPDLLTLATCCGLGVFANSGDGTFPSSVSFPTAPSPFWMAAGDLNGDGQPDVAVVSSDNNSMSRLRVFINASH